MALSLWDRIEGGIVGLLVGDALGVPYEFHAAITIPAAEEIEMRPPAGEHFTDIIDEKGRLLAYLLTFVFVAINRVNHHHLLQVVHRIDGRALWAKIGLLF